MYGTDVMHIYDKGTQTVLNFKGSLNLNSQSKPFKWPFRIHHIMGNNTRVYLAFKGWKTLKKTNQY